MKPHPGGLGTGEIWDGWGGKPHKGKLARVSPKFQFHSKPLQDVTLPRLPRALEDPRPALIVGISVWVLGAVFFGLTRGWTDQLVWTSIIGVVTGVLGYGVYMWQREAVRRGAQWVQDGLD